MTKPNNEDTPNVGGDLDNRFDSILPQGPYTVGFRVGWKVDVTRSFRLSEEATDTVPRPMLFARWYPASPPLTPASLRFGDYLDPSQVEPDAPEEILPDTMKVFTQRLFDFYTDMACMYGIDFTKTRATLNAEEQVSLQHWQGTPTKAVVAATPLPGPFPVVIYHPGLGSSYEDNAAFCAYLASHGYVVISSAYLPEGGPEVGINGDYARSFTDFRFLREQARELPFADTTRLAVIGHSYGAHAATSFAAEPDSGVSAVVSLDSTYEHLDEQKAARLADRLSASSYLTAPLFLCSNRSTLVQPAGLEERHFLCLPPNFTLYEGARHAPRYYVTVGHLYHPDFVSSGLRWRTLRPPRWIGAAEASVAVNTYVQLCETARCFLDASLKDSTEATEKLQSNVQPVSEEAPYRSFDHAFAPTEEPSLVLYYRPATG